MIIEWITFLTVPGDSTIQDNRLKYVQCLKVKREGLGYDIVSSASPVGREARHAHVKGDLVFDTSLPFNPGERVYVLIKH